jgi:hypothetical protein
MQLSNDHVPELFKEHFNQIHATLPHHTHHRGITREEEEVFLEEARSFQFYAANQVFFPLKDVLLTA